MCACVNETAWAYFIFVCILYFYFGFFFHFSASAFSADTKTDHKQYSLRYFFIVILRCTLLLLFIMHRKKETIHTLHSNSQHCCNIHIQTVCKWRQMKKDILSKMSKRWVSESTDRRPIKITSCEIVCVCSQGFVDRTRHRQSALYARVFVFRAQSNYAFVIVRYW